MEEFLIFLKHLGRLYWFSRGVLLIMLLMVMLCGLVVSIFEGLSLLMGQYFIFVTALTIGYGDIAPVTVVGRCVSLFAGILGLTIMGLVVAISTVALRQTVLDGFASGKESMPENWKKRYLE